MVVVGGGDTALEEANYLSRMASKVTVVHRRDTLRASQIMQKRAMDNPKIHFVWDSAVKAIHDPDAGKVTGLTLHNLKTDEESFLPTDGVFIAIGHTPNTKLFDGQLAMDPQGYVITTPGRPLTNVPASSRRATCRTPSTSRPSRRPGRAARPPWTPSASWKSRRQG